MAFQIRSNFICSLEEGDLIGYTKLEPLDDDTMKITEWKELAGKKHGLEVTREGGRVLFESNWEKGVKHGRFRYINNDNKIVEEYYDNGLLLPTKPPDGRSIGPVNTSGKNVYIIKKNDYNLVTELVNKLKEENQIKDVLTFDNTNYYRSSSINSVRYLPVIIIVNLENDSTFTAFSRCPMLKSIMGQFSGKLVLYNPRKRQLPTWVEHYKV